MTIGDIRKLIEDQPDDIVVLDGKLNHVLSVEIMETLVDNPEYFELQRKHNESCDFIRYSMNNPSMKPDESKIRTLFDVQHNKFRQQTTNVPMHIKKLQLVIN